MDIEYLILNVITTLITDLCYYNTLIIFNVINTLIIFNVINTLITFNGINNFYFEIKGDQRKNFLL